LFKWQKYKFYQNDYWIETYLDSLRRIDYRAVSKREFVEKYESKNIPVVITHVTDEWKANRHWTEEVIDYNDRRQIYKDLGTNKY
jgi:histone arginine demethylase JMJD6